MYGSNIVHNLTVEAIRLYLVDGMGKNMSFSFYSWPQVKLTSLLKQCVYFLLKTHYLALDNIGDFDFLRGEDFIEDGVDVCSIDMVILMFGEILNELHDFDSVAICLDPYSKLGVLCLDLVDEVDEHVVHFILHELEIGRVEVGVVVYVRLYFRPPHLAAPLMEQTALLVVQVAVLADQTGLAAGGVGANRETRLGVYAFWTLEGGLCRHVQP